jgi:acetolactate decarboxylase
MKTISCSLPDSLAAALERRMDGDKDTLNYIVARALSQYLATPLHTLFQVSTSAALVEIKELCESRVCYSVGISST